MKILCTILLFFVFSISYCQTTSIKYYKDVSLEKETTKEKAKYICTTIANKDSLYIEVFYKKDKEIIAKEYYKNDEPVGIWFADDYKKGKRSIDYNFELTYAPDSVFKSNTEKNTDTTKHVYTDPIMYEGEKDYYRSIAKFVKGNIHTSYKSLMIGNSGKVFVYFVINKDGKLDKIGVKNGSDVTYAKEALRVVRNMSFYKAGLQDGEATRTSFILPIRFDMEE